MESTRRARIESVIREEVSMLLSREIKDPRIPALTLTSVQLTPDAGLATILFITARMGFVSEADQINPPQMSEKVIEDCLAGLASCKGFIRRHLSKVLTLRTMPELVFKADRGLENSQRVHELLRTINQTTGEKSDKPGNESA